MRGPSEGSPVDDATCISASSFSYAELEEKLNGFHPTQTLPCLQQKCSKVVETLVSGLRGMVQQHDLFSDLLRTVDYTKAFVSQRKNNEEKLRLRLEQTEASLSALERITRLSGQSLLRQRAGRNLWTPACMRRRTR
ncbi:hypothetical protein CK203_076906 [Vitis vinifera]|uniref:Uncharacterized protein n=1 Tax=Vitis vinifera TaxID=29760 RepID=A0A438DZG5_VITVI|nr:hypothetical protein CK203_076906 [Vitis vinifera]